MPVCARVCVCVFNRLAYHVVMLSYVEACVFGREKNACVKLKQPWKTKVDSWYIVFANCDPCQQLSLAGFQLSIYFRCNCFKFIYTITPFAKHVLRCISYSMARIHYLIHLMSCHGLNKLKKIVSASLFNECSLASNITETISLFLSICLEFLSLVRNFRTQALLFCFVYVFIFFAFFLALTHSRSFFLAELHHFVGAISSM